MGGGIRNGTIRDMRGGGVQKSSKKEDGIYGWPLSSDNKTREPWRYNRLEHFYFYFF